MIVPYNAQILLKVYLYLKSITCIIETTEPSLKPAKSIHEVPIFLFSYLLNIIKESIAILFGY